MPKRGFSSCYYWPAIVALVYSLSQKFRTFNLPTAFWGLLGPQKDVNVNFTKTVTKQTTIL